MSAEDGVSFATRLHHVQFNKILLFAELWVTLLAIALFWNAKVPFEMFVGSVVLLVLHYVLNKHKHAVLEHNVGIPGSKITVAF